MKKSYTPEQQAAINNRFAYYVRQIDAPEFDRIVTTTAEELHDHGMASGDRINEILSGVGGKR
jgi:hypothetical protein